MGAEVPGDWRATAASTLAWWHDAGVDLLVEEAPHDWLAAPVPVPIAPVAPVPVAAGAALPDDLPVFLAWRMGDGAPDAGWRGVAIAASGPADAAVMVLTDCPDREDDAAGTLLAGAAGRLFDRMLAAVGLSRDRVHLASVCARRPLAGRMPAELEGQLGEVARHHVALVAPQRLLLMGNAAARAILGADGARARGGLQSVDHRRGKTGAVATHHPRLLLQQPACKADAWKDLQLLMRGLAR